MLVFIPQGCPALGSVPSTLTQPLAVLERLLDGVAGGAVPVADAAPVLHRVGVDLVVTAHVLQQGPISTGPAPTQGFTGIGSSSQMWETTTAMRTSLGRETAGKKEHRSESGASWSVFAGWVAHPGGLQCGFLTLVFACSPLSCSYSSEKPEGHLITFPCPALQPRVSTARQHMLRAVPSWASLLILGLADPVSKRFPKTFPTFCWSSPHLGPRQLPNCSIKWRLHLTPHNKNCSQFPKGPAGPRAIEKPLV